MPRRLWAIALAILLLLELSACGLPEDFGKAEVFEVRFEMNGGTLEYGQLLQEVAEGGAAEEPKVQRDGYFLAGWSEPFDNVSSNMVVVAQWAKLFTVTFDSAGGTVIGGKATQELMREEMPSPPQVSKENAEFAGWEPEVTAAVEDAVYVAQWRQLTFTSQEVYSIISPAVVEVKVFNQANEQKALGSGFFIDDTGTLITNYHVISGGTSVKATLSDGSTVDVTGIQGYDETLDLAILSTGLSGNPYLSLAEGGVTTGETVYALGSSNGFTSTFSEGIVSTAVREVEGVACIQTTAPISRGNSGGPLVNDRAQVVGVNSMSLATGQNLNFAIEISQIGLIDRSHFLTMDQFDQGSSGQTASAANSDSGFYGVADLAEAESNDTIFLANSLASGKWVAGEMLNSEDEDYYSLNVEKPCKVTIEVVPYYKMDNDFLVAGLCKMGESELEMISVLGNYTEGHYEVEQYLEYELPEAGIYFLLIIMRDEYSYTEPAYYMLRANW